MENLKIDGDCRFIILLLGFIRHALMALSILVCLR